MNELKTLADISRTLSKVENRSEDYLDILDELYKKGKNSKVIGITGAPGAGKSTLVDVYINLLAESGKKVAVIAVDPSSPFSGGAILGDRIRMSHNSDNIFIRSVATRGAVGGVSDAVFNMIVVFRAAGYDYIVIETVGVGQNEVSISKLSDLTLLVLTPGSGDDIQTMKAGIMEIADIFVINKSDVSGADQMEAYLKASIPELSDTIIRTSALKQTGIKELVERVELYYKNEKEKIEAKSKEVLKQGLKTLLMQELSKKVDAIMSKTELRIEEIIQAKTSPYEEMKRLLKETI